MVKPNRLWVVEKPSMALCLVAGLRMAHGVRTVNDSRADGYHMLSNGDAVASLLGHLVEQPLFSPEQKQIPRDRALAALPIRNDDLPLEPRADTDKTGKPRLSKDGRPIPTRAYTVVTRLMRDSREIVNAGDVDREGQLIVDELLEHVGIDPEGRNKPIWRLPLVSTKEEDIARLVGKLEHNGDTKWVRKRHAALARSICDKQIGANGSMAYQAVMNYSATSVGRVQTPVLWIVGERDLAIERFKPRDYFVPVIMLADGTEMRWHRREGAEGQPGFDDQGRITDRGLAQQIVERIARGFGGTVTLAESKTWNEAPPLPFSATVLASTVAKRYGMSPKEAEKAAQSLDERHKAISYVGTDCRFLPTSMHADARNTLQALADGRVFVQQVNAADPTLQGKAWNDDKVDEHFAIVPTGRVPDRAALTQDEANVFETVCKRFVAQFHQDHQFIRTSLQAVFGDDEFRASTREVTRAGWKSVEGDADNDAPEPQEPSERPAQVVRAAPRSTH